MPLRCNKHSIHLRHHAEKHCQQICDIAMGYCYIDSKRSHQHEALHTALYVEALLQLPQEVDKPGMHIDNAMEQPVKMLQDLRMPLHA